MRLYSVVSFYISYYNFKQNINEFFIVGKIIEVEKFYINML